MSEQNQSMNEEENLFKTEEPQTLEEKRNAYLMKLKWSTFFQAGFFVAMAGYLSKFGWQIYSLKLTQGIHDYKVLGLIAILYIGAYIIAIMQYKAYKKESGRTW